jgi:hypothetical protein
MPGFSQTTYVNLISEQSETQRRLFAQFSVMPYSSSANPVRTLAALALRLRAPHRCDDAARQRVGPASLAALTGAFVAVIRRWIK